MASYTRTAVLVALLTLAAQPATAQGLWDSLFGPDEIIPSRPASGYVRARPTMSLFNGLFNPTEHDTPQPSVRAATYRTLCVRMCDGFYFPISHATSSANFTHDAEKCAASCSGARLFYAPNPGSDVGGMLDLTGRAYASYPIAFRYRKTLVESCQCRPQPWNEAERARHRAYAAAQSPAGQYAEPQTDVEAGATAGARTGFASGPLAPGFAPPYMAVPDFTAQDDLRAVTRPMPVDRKLEAEQLDRLFETSPPGQVRSRYSRPGMR